MIVKNGARGLDRCLDSVSGIVDRIVIGDTGSSDGTAEIARRHGAEFFALVWKDDFAQARNQVLARACCDWILVLDADEMLDKAEAASLHALLHEDAVWSYDLWRWNYVREPGFRSAGEQAVANPGTFEHAVAYPAYFRTRHTRLFRRDPRIRFDHCVHESVVDSLEAARLLRGEASFVIHHFGYVDDAREVRDKKDAHYHRLALAKLASAPGSYQAQLEAGMGELDYAKQPDVALEHFTAASSINPAMYVGWLYRGICLTRVGRYDEALVDLARAAALSPESPLAHSARGDAYFQKQNYSQAQQAYEKACSLGDVSPLSLAKCGAAEVQLGRPGEGLIKVRAAVAASPDTPELLDILSTTALLAGEPAIACDAASRRLAMAVVTEFHFLLAATIHMQAGEVPKAKLILYIGSQLFPEDPEINQMMASCSKTGSFD